MQKDVYFGLQRGTEVLKEINREMGGLEKVERMMEDSEEAREEQRRIGEALAGGLSNMEEDEVEEEMERMEKEVLPEVPRETVVGEGAMPDVPVGEVGEEEREKRRKERARERRVAMEAS